MRGVVTLLLFDAGAGTVLGEPSAPREREGRHPLTQVDLGQDSLHKVRGPNEGIDWTAIGMLAVGLGCLQTLLEEGNSQAWFESALIRVLILAASVGLMAFALRELRSGRPVVDLYVLRYRSLWAGSLLSAKPCFLRS